MADTGTHSRLRGRIKAALKAMPGVMVTNGDPSDGALDLILCVDGRYAELDVKTGQAVLNKAQQIRMAQVWRCGGHGSADTVGSVQQAKSFINRLKGSTL